MLFCFSFLSSHKLNANVYKTRSVVESYSTLTHIRKKALFSIEIPVARGSLSPVCLSVNKKSQISPRDMFFLLSTPNMENLFGKKKLTRKRSRTMPASVSRVISAGWGCAAYCVLSGTQTMRLRKSHRDALMSRFSGYQYWAPKLKTAVSVQLQIYVFWILLKWASALSYSLMYFTLTDFFRMFVCFACFSNGSVCFPSFRDKINYGLW